MGGKADFTSGSPFNLYNQTHHSINHRKRKKKQRVSERQMEKKKARKSSRDPSHRKYLGRDLEVKLRQLCRQSYRSVVGAAESQKNRSSFHDG